MKSFAALILLATLTLVAPAEVFGQRLPKALIITGNGNIPDYNPEYPPWQHEFQNQMVVEILKGIVHVDTTADLTILASSRLHGYDLIISNSIFLKPTKEQLEGLYNFVSGGKSYMTLHCGILSLLNWDKYEEFIGGVFIGGPSSVPAAFDVHTENMEFWGYEYSFRNIERHPVSIVTEDFTTKDELYHFQPAIRDFHVIARAENLPVMWWHPVGKGKVMSLTLGHDAQAKTNPGYQALLRNGVIWLTGIPLISGDQPKPVSTRKHEYDNFITLKGYVTPDKQQSLRFRIEKNQTPELYEVESTQDGNISLKLKGSAGQESFIAVVEDGNGLSSTKRFNVTIVKDGAGNIASYFGNTAKSSSNENESGVLSADKILDGNPSTRWSSAAGETASITIDLQKDYRIRTITLKWEASFATAYSIEGSQDGTRWATLKAITNGDGGTDTYKLNGTPTRHIRVNMTQRSKNKWGYSLFEVEVFE